jgi:protein-S-isoprenylcysteine O-methyltransferase Ste14
MAALKLFYRLFAYCSFLVVFAAFPLFMANLMGFGVERPGVTPTALAVAIDFGLIALFGLQHTVMAGTERSTFVLMSSLCLALLMWFWQSIPTTIFVLTGTPALALHAVNAVGFAIALVASFHLDHAALFGLKAEGESALRTPGLYRFVRHPLMTGILLMLWVTPVMSVGRLLLAGLMTVYIHIGTGFEERKLRRLFGRD